MMRFCRDKTQKSSVFKAFALLSAIAIAGCQSPSATVPVNPSIAPPEETPSSETPSASQIEQSLDGAADVSTTDSLSFGNIDQVNIDNVASKLLTTRADLPGNVEAVAIATPTDIQIRVTEHQSPQVTVTFTVVGESSTYLTNVTEQDLAQLIEGNQLKVQAIPSESCDGMTQVNDRIHSLNGACLLSAKVLIPSNRAVDVYAIETDETPDKEMVWLGQVPDSAPALVNALPKFNGFSPSYEQLTLIQRFSQQRADAPVSYDDYLAIIDAVRHTHVQIIVTELLAPQIKRTEDAATEADINALLTQNASLFLFEEELRAIFLN